MAAVNHKQPKTSKGTVYLVGAGPGRADLITVRGAQLLKTADCVIYDKLANPALLNYVGPDAEIIHVPKRIGTGSFTQEQINGLLVDKAGEGKKVVRLKGGDPCIFGRGAEEAKVLAEAGIDFEIVPGVTAAVAAGEYTGIMLTDRNYSSELVFVTGQEAAGKQETNIDWDCLAKFGGTIVFYMGMGNLGFIAQQLIKNGKPQQTPAAVIADASMPSQRVVKASLDTIADKCIQENVGPPAIIVIGTAAASGEQLNWFGNRPLFGKSIVVTRDSRGNIDVAAWIVARGGRPIEFPTIKLQPLTNSNRFLEALAMFSEYDWIIFTSANGVRFLFDALDILNKDSRVFGTAKVGVIGSETARQLAEFGIKADFMPDVFTGPELAKQLIAFTNVAGKKLLLLRSDVASKDLPALLKSAKAEVDDVAIYRTVTLRGDSEQLTKEIAEGAVDWVTFASPSAVRGFFEQIPTDLVNSSVVKVASIGPVTSQELKNFGVKVDVEAAEHTIDDLLAAVERMCE